MFEENKNNIEQDILFRSILEEGQEQVPVHVWDKIEEDLDRISRRRTAVLWFRRSVLGAAAAAVLALVLLHDTGSQDDIIKVSETGQIALVQQGITPLEEEVEAIAENPSVRTLLSYNPAPVHKAAEVKEMADMAAEETSEEASEEAESVQEAKQKQSGAKKEFSRPEEIEDTFPEVWPDEQATRKKRISLTVSGIAGTNSAQNSIKVNPMKSPAISSAPKKTGIKETSTNTTYGIPVSVGAGVRIGIAPKWSIGTGINYTLLTRKFYGNYISVGESGTIQKDISSDIRESQHFIGIPVNFYYDIINRNSINLYAYAGGAVEKCVADRFQVLGTDINHTEKIKGMQLSADLGMGVEFMLGRHLGIYLDPSIRYFFDNNQPKSIRTAQPLMFGFEMGLRAKL